MTAHVATEAIWITCYADASYRKGAGAWGVYLRGPDKAMKRQGVCPDYVHDSLDAELSAIFAGIWLARRTWGPVVRGVFVRTDCMTAIEMLTAPALRPRIVRRRPGTVRLRARILDLARDEGVELDLRWVPGHQEGDGTRAYLNRVVDGLAASLTGRKGPR